MAKLGGLEELLRGVGRVLLQDDSTDVDITWQGGFVIGTLLVGLLIMAFDLVGPDFVFAGLAALYMAVRVITTAEGVSGFSNTGVLSVIALYVVAEGIAQTGGLERMMSGVLGKRAVHFWALVRMFLPTFLSAAFLNNTPIVAMLIPILMSWGNRRGVSPKKLLIPLSYFTILGGTCTLIGTSTNLVVAGLQSERYTGLGQPEDAAFGFFDITPYGISYGAFGLVYILVASQWLLPGGTAQGPSGVLLVARVMPGSKLHNKTVREAGLKGMTDLFLVSVGRAGHLTHAVGPDHLLEEGDALYLKGTLEAAEALAGRMGLQLLTADEEDGDSLHDGSGELAPAGGSAHNSGASDGSSGGGGGGEGGGDLAGGLSVVGDPERAGAAALPAHTQLVQATVARGSDFAGVAVRDSHISRRFGGARVLAVKRGADRETQPGGALSNIVLQAGDVLVLVVDATLDVKSNKPFRAQFRDARPLGARAEKEYITGMRVQRRSRMIGKTLGEAGLVGVSGLSVVSIDREDGQALRTVHQDTEVKAGDVLWFSGSLDGVAYLLRMPGVAHMHESQVDKMGVSVLERRLIQASVAMDSPLAGQTVREASFRAKYDAVVISISRHGEEFLQDVRDVRLQPGDVLLIDAGSRFLHRYKDDRAFNLLSEVPNTSPLKTRRMWWALFLGFVLVATQLVAGAAEVETVDLLPAAILTGGAMIATHCMTGEQARRSVNWDVYTTIAFAFGVSTALQKTTVAAAIAEGFKWISEAIGGKTAPLVAMYVATGLLSEIITNNAAAALMYPIAAELGDMLGIEPTLISVAVMLGASAAFIMPIGYQCNLMVFSAGQYKTREFVKFGVPMQANQICAALVIFLFVDQPWLVAGLASAGAAGFVALCALWSFVLTDAAKARIVPGWLQRRRAMRSRSRLP